MEWLELILFTFKAIHVQDLDTHYKGFMRTLKYVPEKIGVLHGKGLAIVPVIGVKTYPAGQHPKGSCIVADMIAVEIRTEFGSRWYGSTVAFIDSTLRMVIDINPRDEVLAKWEDFSGTVPAGFVA